MMNVDKSVSSAVPLARSTDGYSTLLVPRFIFYRHNVALKVRGTFNGICTLLVDGIYLRATTPFPR
jgi:hypothetical protein